MTEAVFSAACLWVTAEPEDEARLMQLCESAAERLLRQLPKGVTAQQVGESFTQAAAMMAAADFSELAEDAQVQQLSAGPVSVTRLPGGRAKILRRQAEALMAPWCSGGFRFMGVRT